MSKKLLGFVPGAIAGAMLFVLPVLAATTVVTPTDMNSWYFYNDQTDQLQADTADHGMVSGPATPVLGIGSAHLTKTTNDKYGIATTQFAGTPLPSITTLSYSTYRASGTSAQAPSLGFDIDSDATDIDTGYQGRLTYEPYFTQTVDTASWQTWNTLDGAATATTTTGNWWFSHATLSNGASSVCTQSDPCTWAELNAAYPNAAMANPGQFILRTNGADGEAFDGNVDNLTVGVSGVDTTFDFDPTPVSTTVYVNSDNVCGGQTPCYMTIQDGLDAVASGGTVNVQAGSYAGDLTIANPVTLSGAGAPSTSIDGQITVDAASTSISGFTISSPTHNFGILIDAVGSTSITANKITGIASSPNTQTNSYGIYYQSHSTGDVSGIIIDDNTINDIGSGIVGFSDGAIGIGDSSGSGVLSNVSITNNAIATVYSSNKGAYGILLNHGAHSGGSVASPVISGNSVASLNSGSGWIHGIALETDTPNASVIDNSLNTFTTSSADNAAVHFEDNASADTVTLSQNSFDTNTIAYGLTSTVSPAITAANNFWNTGTSSPASKILAAGSVSYSPWYTDPAMTTRAYEFATSTNGSENTATTGGSTTTLEGTSTQSGSVDVTVEIPAGTTITGSTTWNGVIETPTTATTTVTVSGFDTTVIASVSVGSDDSDLFFDKAVKLTFEGQAGKLVGWYNHAGTFTEISDTCTGSNDEPTQTTNLGPGGSCKLDDSGNLVIWTKHFSIFVAYTQTAQSSGTTNTSGGGGGGNGAPAGTLGTTNAVIPTTDNTGATNTNTNTNTTNTDTASGNTSAPIAQGNGGEVLGSEGSGSATVVGSAASTGPEEIASSTGETTATSTDTGSSTVDLSASAANSGASIPTWGWIAIAIVVLAGIGGVLFYNRPQPK